MRHGVMGRKLARTNAHRLALRRNLAQSLFEHGEIRTTLPKAKEIRRFVDRLVSLAIDGSLAARQRAEALLTDRQIIPKENQKDYDRMSDAKRAKVLRSRSGRRHRENKPRAGLKFSSESVLNRLFKDIGPRMKRRNEKMNASGGYTRIIKTAQRRLGDAGLIAIVQLVGEDDKPRTKNKTRSERKRRATVKYAVYAGKPRTARTRRKTSKPESKPAAPPAGAADAPKE
ncbi:MAG: 50S ribosomal protein L17 [Phycisphaerales bacterium]|nr:50S ribosomal protein L17 [Phycisphaerales bacterium]